MAAHHHHGAARGDAPGRGSGAGFCYSSETALCYARAFRVHAFRGRIVMKLVRKMSWSLLAVLLAAAALPPQALAQSQATTAEINGRVADAQGGVLPGVTVTA